MEKRYSRSEEAVAREPNYPSEATLRGSVVSSTRQFDLEEGKSFSIPKAGKKSQRAGEVISSASRGRTNSSKPSPKHAIQQATQSNVEADTELQEAKS